MWDDPKLMNAVAGGLALVAGAGLAAAVLLWLVRLPAFELREVIVTTPLTRANPAQLEAAIRDELAGTFFTVNLDRARSALAQVPWVRRVTLARRWPRRLEVAVEEHAPLARWNADSLVNTQGEVFVADYGGELPAFEGGEGRAAEVTARYAEWSAALAPLSLTLAQVRVSARGGWRLSATGPGGALDIELGRDAPGERLARLVAAWPRTIGALARAGTRVDRVDLRYRNGFAARVPGFVPRPGRKA
jgi:cell division protein FtsQ